MTPYLLIIIGVLLYIIDRFIFAMIHPSALHGYMTNKQIMGANAFHIVMFIICIGLIGTGITLIFIG